MSTDKTDAPRLTGKWKRDDVPHSGWVCVEITDGDLCEMCEVTRIACAHVMTHPRWPLPLYCGCVCAGFMTEAPGVEHVREVLYKWRQMQLEARTPIEKIRRKGWSRSRYLKHPHVFGWSLGGRVFDTEHFEVEISNTDGWRYHIYHPRRQHSELLRSEPFATDQLAALAGIEKVELLMADPLWIAADCEAEAETLVVRERERAERDLDGLATAAEWSGRNDIRAALLNGQMRVDVAKRLLFDHQSAGKGPARDPNNAGALQYD